MPTAEAAGMPRCGTRQRTRVLGGSPCGHGLSAVATIQQSTKEAGQLMLPHVMKHRRPLTPETQEVALLTELARGMHNAVKARAGVMQANPPPPPSQAAATLPHLLLLVHASLIPGLGGG
jgi:hypothetical protein